MISEFTLLHSTYFPCEDYVVTMEAFCDEWRLLQAILFYLDSVDC